MEWWEVKTALGGGAGEAEEEVGKCKPNVGPGHSQEKQTLAGAWSGAPLGRAGRAGTDVWRKERRGGGKSRKTLEQNSQPRGQGHFPAISGLVSLESSEVQAQSSLNEHQSPT